MIISKTPFRISFFGGGTDYPVWYKENGGSVLSTSIDKYCYISTRYLPPFFDFKYSIRYRIEEKTKDINEIQHPSVRECLKYLGVKDGIEMAHSNDLPARSGIGSSSSFTVGFLNALYALNGKMTYKKQLAQDAINIEQNLIKENVGSQDQIAAAFGGLNRIDFDPSGDFAVRPVTIDKARIDDLQKNLMFFFTGFSREASEIAKEQIKSTPDKKKELFAMRQMVDEAVNILNNKNNNLDNFGKLLNENWNLKKSLTSLISNQEIDNIYNAGIGAGALGGKLCGAGGGGFMLFYVPEQNQPKVKETLKHLLQVPFKFENEGSQIIFHTERETI
jgi:D-glycero-alpha-D-manno-heptose-7-phosphate kinase